MSIDLHTHTTASDGALTPEELVASAASLGLRAIAVCDHDTVDGVGPALDAGRALGVRVVPSVELSAAVGGLDLHILGFCVDPSDPTLRACLDDLRAARLTRARSMVCALRDAGHDVSMDEVLLLARGGSVGRSHVARALVDQGVVRSLRDAFEQLIGRGRPFYVAKPVTGPDKVISLVLGAGGVPVIAHAAVTGAMHLLPSLAEAGLLGIEVYHPEHDAAARAGLLSVSQRLGLLVTGGSDYHGPGAGAGLGCCDVPDGLLEPLLAAARAA
ncbi:MAG: PHP domain-containing protein [Coriobacteriia bacterium]